MARRRTTKRVLKPRAPSRVRKTKRAKRKPTRGHQHPELIGLGLLAFGLFLATVLWAGWNGGYVGGWIGEALQALIGGAAYVLPVVLVVVGGLMVARSDLVDVRPFRTGLAVFGVGLLLTLGDEGGYLGGVLSDIVAFALGRTGAALVGVLAILAGMLLLTGASIGAVIRRGATAARQSFERPARHTVDEPPELISTANAAPIPLVDAAAESPDVIGQAEPASLIPFPDPDTQEESDQESLFNASPAVQDYKLPDRNVLRKSGTNASAPAEASGQVAQALVQALADFGVQASVGGQIVGPRVTRYELQLAPGTKMSKVSALKDDLSYALATTEIRILAPIPGKQAVGVEVPNLTPNLVTLGDIYDDLPQSASPVAVWLGKDISGNAVWTDLARMPHILIAGTTGSGKSGCINTMLTSVLLRATPDEVRMILIDPKRIELSFYEQIPHLLAPVVSSPKEAPAVLTNVIAEMERRYERLSKVRARNLSEANRAFRQRGEEELPYLLVVIDELADLMMVSPQEVEDSIIRLAQKSRAVGIHLVLATQRPSVDVITGMI